MRNCCWGCATTTSMHSHQFGPTQCQQKMHWTKAEGRKEVANSCLKNISGKQQSPALTACCPICRTLLSNTVVIFIAEIAACSLIENKLDFLFSFSVSHMPVCEYGCVCVQVPVYMYRNVWMCICTYWALRKQESERGVWNTPGRTNWICMQTPDLVLGREGCCNPSGASLQMLFLCSSSVCYLQGNSSEGGFWPKQHRVISQEKVAFFPATWHSGCVQP